MNKIRVCPICLHDKASIPLMLAIVFFGGIQLLAISIFGKYIQVIVEETKNRPVYIVDKTINLKK